jgi:hypothetical protein
VQNLCHNGSRFYIEVFDLRILFVFTICFFAFGPQAQSQSSPLPASDAEQSQDSLEDQSSPSDEEAAAKPAVDTSPTWFSSRLRMKPGKERNAFWWSVGSFLLPGFDQFFEQQYRAGFTYAGGAYIGLLIYSQAQAQIENEESLEEEFEGAGDYNKSDDKEKRLLFGASLYQFMGSMSAYQAFRTAARSHIESESDRFDFLKQTIEEDAGDVMLAPFDFRYFVEPTSWAPLLLVGGLVAYDLSRPGVGDGEVTTSEGVFLSNISYHAGVGEEALFRGWIFPYLYEETESYFWANTLQAAFFAYLHVTPTYKVPYYQFAFGWYAGYLAKRNNWSIEEAAFVHTWWDIIAFTALFLNDGTREQAQVQVPVLQMSF